MHRLRLGALLVVAVHLVPRLAAAHTYIMQPVSRDAKLVASLDARAYKNTEGPCGVVRPAGTPLPRTNMPTQYAVGDTITVKWQETIDHQGCFQVLLSQANDENWQLLAQYDDPKGSPDDEITTKQIKLPDGVSCKDCTLSVRQLMINAACPPNAVADPASTYYSCADIRIGDFPDAGPTQPPMSNEPETDAGTSTSQDAGSGGDGTSNNTDNKSTPRRLSNNSPDEGGCAAGGTDAGGLGVALTAVAGALAILQRRRRRAS